MKNILLMAMAALSITACATPLAAPSFKEAPVAFNQEYDKVWAASIDALHEYTLDSSNKEMHQISTKPVRSTDFMANQIEKVITVKISQEKPYRVSVQALVNRNIEVASRGSFGRKVASNDNFSDTAEEQRLIQLISDKLK